MMPPQTAQEQVNRIPKRILVVEDDDLLRDLLCRSLSRFGFETQHASNGEEAYRIFTESVESTDPSKSLDAAVTDYLMPRADGADLIKKIKAIRPEFPIVLVTGEAPDSEILKLAALPQVIALLKPFRPEALKQVLQSILHEPLVAGRSDLRKSIRVDSSIACSISKEDDMEGKAYFASVRNLGFGGCFLQTDVPLVIGQKIRFIFQGLERYVLTACVAWQNHSGVGVTLIRNHPEADLFYKKFVLNKLKQKGVGIMGVNSASEAVDCASSG
ncbi:MAG: response regulator [Bdellovibrionia bacterium]